MYDRVCLNCLYGLDDRLSTLRACGRLLALRGLRRYAGDVGRPSSFTQEIADDICERMINGESLRTISNQDGMPHPETICRWPIAPLKYEGS